MSVIQLILYFLASNIIALVGYCNFEVYKKIKKITEINLSREMQCSVNKNFIILSIILLALWISSVYLISSMVNILNTLELSNWFYIEMLIYCYCICSLILTLAINFMSIYRRETLWSLTIISLGYLSYYIASS